jgi:hypothetical protein
MAKAARGGVIAASNHCLFPPMREVSEDHVPRCDPRRAPPPCFDVEVVRALVDCFVGTWDGVSNPPPLDHEDFGDKPANL